MSYIVFEDERIELGEGQTVLAGLLSHGYDIPNTCGIGICQTCLLQATDGTVPATAQRGLKDTLQAQNYFLACSCKPVEPLSISLPTRESLRFGALVSERRMLSPQVLLLRLRALDKMETRAGQYLTLWRDETVGRSYSVAAIAQEDNVLDLHIGRVANGQVSGWLHEEVCVGDKVELQGPAGDCFYVPGNATQTLLLAGTGTGLAPLIGIAKDALVRGHSGDIHLLHGAADQAGLYCDKNLKGMANQSSNFYYHTHLRPAGRSVAGWAEFEGAVLRLAEAVDQAKAYLCGDPATVKNLRKKLFLAGAGVDSIYADAFEPARSCFSSCS